MWQHVNLSVQIRPWDTVACCWDVKQPHTGDPPECRRACEPRRCALYTEREREGGGDGGGGGEARDRQTDTETDRDRDRQTETNRQTDRQIGRQAGRQADRQKIIFFYPVLSMSLR